jgi:ATP-dependent helicase/nuclease subunit A
MPEPTPQQRRAIEASGDVLVMAGAGAGKTSTLVGRILHRVLSGSAPASVDRFLVVTFTDAAAGEMRRRLGAALEERLAHDPTNTWIAEQLALLETAQVSTLHAFCLRLLREHFQELALDPRFVVQDPAHTAVLRRQVLRDILDAHYREEAPESDVVRAFLDRHARDDERLVVELTMRVHDHARSLPDPEGWLARMDAAWSESLPEAWRHWLGPGVAEWARGWRDHVEMLRVADPDNFAARECAEALDRAAAGLDREGVVDALTSIARAGEKSRFRRGYSGRWRKPLEKLFNEAAELMDLVVLPEPGAVDPLENDWRWAREDVRGLLALTRQFSEAFAAARRSAAVLDFADLEQGALALLWDRAANAPTALAREWQERIDHVLVDECQDINGAQDRIIRCVSRSGAAANRFFVGDVKQSIYRFRRADPAIFQTYAREWRAMEHAQVVPLAENFRSHERILAVVNEIFRRLMRESVGGVSYDAEAELVFGAPALRPALRESPEGRVEFHLHVKPPRGGGEESQQDTGSGDEGNGVFEEDLDAEEAQAGIIARRLKELRESGLEVWDAELGRHRPVSWRDMVVLHPAPRPVAERWARQFAAAAVPLEARRSGFFESLEVADLANLARLLDNPRQDHPLVAVLRSPLVGMSVNELAALRLSARKPGLWDALVLLAGSGTNPPTADAPTPSSSQGEPDDSGAASELRQDDDSDEWAAIVASAKAKAELFLSRYRRWRRLAREASLTWALESILAETEYEAVLRAGQRSEARLANLRRFLDLSREFDQLQRHALFRFLQFLDAQEESAFDPESPSAAASDSVRLMSIHQSKGLEFPVAVVAGLGRAFNLQDLRGAWMIDEQFGICPPVIPPGALSSYESLPRWLVENRQMSERAGENLRLLYVACTRAADRLILVGTTGEKAIGSWAETGGVLSNRAVRSATTPLHWLGPLMGELTGRADWAESESGRGLWLDWRVHRPESTPAPAEDLVQAELSLPSPSETVAVDVLQAKLDFAYPWTRATHEPAKATVTRLARSWSHEDSEESVTVGPAHTRRGASGVGLDEAVHRGTAHHEFLELMDFAAATSPEGLKAEAARLVEGGLLTVDQAATLDFDGLWAFWSSELGRRIRSLPKCVHREMPFTARLTPADEARLRGNHDFAAAGGLPPGLEGDDFQVIQGIVDLAVLLEREIWLIDFKTDRVRDEAEARERANAYRFQVELYARALEAIHRRPVTRRCLCFISARTTVELG